VIFRAYSSVHRSCSVFMIHYVTVRSTCTSNYENGKYTQNILTPMNYARHFTEVRNSWHISHTTLRDQYMFSALFTLFDFSLSFTSYSLRTAVSLYISQNPFSLLFDLFRF
jgi:DNA-binding XRE family transcriptional regulator